jgi:hypothetical protein
VDRIPVLDVEKIQPLAEQLRLVVALDSETLARIDAPETPLQFRQDLLLHREPPHSAGLIASCHHDGRPPCRSSINAFDFRHAPDSGAKRTSPEKRATGNH